MSARKPKLFGGKKVKRKDLLKALIADTWFMHGDLPSLSHMSEGAFNSRILSLKVGKTKKVDGMGKIKKRKLTMFFMTQDDIDSIPEHETPRAKGPKIDNSEAQSTDNKMFNLFMGA